MDKSEVNRKKICVVTGTRADYAKLFALARHLPVEHYNVAWFVTGMHMRQAFGLTSKEVHRDNNQVYEYINHNQLDDLSSILVKTVSGFKDFLEEFSPDAVLVHGDRIEALAVSIVCANAYVRLLHVEGGEVSGTIDESYRHAISKFSHIHFVSSNTAATRLRLLGEPAERIFQIGSPELDLHAENSVQLEDVLHRYEIPFHEYGVFIFHSVTSEIDNLTEVVAGVARGLISCGKNFVVIRPNNDPGQEIVNKMLDSLPKAQFRIIPSMRFSNFSTLLKNAQIFIGNSSCGVREAPFLGITSIDIGSRQKRRSYAKSIVPFDPEVGSDRLNQLIVENWGKKYRSDDGFGDGDAGQRFLKIMNGDKIWALDLQKCFEDPPND